MFVVRIWYIGIVCEYILAYVAEGRISFDMLRVNNRMNGFERCTGPVRQVVQISFSFHDF